VVRLASSGTATSSDGTGYTVYSNAFLIVMVPHAVVTVSLATAVLPRLSARAAEGRRDALAGTLASTLRTALALIIPFALLLPLVSDQVSNIVWGYGATSATYSNFAPSLALFAPGLVLFTVHYMMLRGFYALEQTRTVFLVQCGVAATNIALALVLVSRADAEATSPALVLAYVGSYVVGAATSYLVLRGRLGGLRTPELVRFLVRLLVAAGVATGLAGGAAWLLEDSLGGDGKADAVLFLGLVSLLDLVAFLALARLMRLREVTDMVQAVTQRLPLRGRG
jgi:putative peptidoglycan lipid II flippase